MTFLNLNLLWAGLGCIAIPIIVHLLTRRRRKPVAWAAMRFLLEAYKKHRRRLTLEQLILLACRCALVGLLATAIGKPVIDGMGAGASGPRVLYLLVDNGVASSVVGPDGKTALANHKAGAARLLAQLDPLRGDRAGLVALGAPIDPMVVPASGDLGAVGRVVESLEATDSRSDLAAALSRVGADLSGPDAGDRASVTLALLSEWRAGSADTERPLPALAASVRPGATPPLILAAEPRSEGVDNVSVLRVEPLRPIMVSGSTPGPSAPAADETPATESNPVRIVLSRRGPGLGAAAVTKLSVRADATGQGARKGPITGAVVRWTPGQEQASTTVSVEVARGTDAPGAFAIIAEIDRDALPADNTRRRPVESRPSVGIGLATAPGASRPSSIDRFTPADWLRLAIAPDQNTGAPIAGLRVVEVEPRTIGAGGATAGLDALLVPAPDRLDGAGWARVGEFVRAGGLVVVFAPAEVGVQLWADEFLKSTGVGWTIARESRSITPPAELADAPGASDLLALLSGEFAELGKPVRVSRVVPVDVGQASADVLLRLRDGSPLVLAASPRAAPGAPPSRGLVVLFAAACDLGWTDLPTKPLMLPLVQEIVRQGIGAARGMWAAEAGAAPVLPAGTVELSDVGGGGAIALPAGAPPALRKAGLWIARDARGSSLGLVAVNVDQAGADTTPRARADLAPWLGAIAGPQRLQWSADLSGPATSDARTATRTLDAESRPPLSAPLLAGAACIALLELLLARLFSHASAASSTPVPGRTA